MIDHGNGHRTRYLHLNTAPLPPNGQFVGRGEVVGYEGTTGASTGPHLHVETRHGATAVDPYSPGTYMWEDQPAGGQPPNHADFSPAVASWTSNRVDVFVRGKDATNNLWQRTRTGGTWSGWTHPRPGDCLRSAPAASTWGANRIDLFYRGCNDVLYCSIREDAWGLERERENPAALAALTTRAMGA